MWPCPPSVCYRPSPRTEQKGANLAATMLGALGLPGSRMQFPLATGINAFGPICAVSLAISVTLAIRNEQRKLAIAGAVFSLYAILAIDSRGAMLFGVLAIAVVTLVPHARRRGLSWIAVALPLMLAIAVTTLGALSGPAQLDRETAGGSSIDTGSSRLVVWREVSDTITQPRLETLVGWGRNGQLTSGASVGYAYLFRGQFEPLLASAHNALLQTLLDIGLVGALCVILLSAVMLRQFARGNAGPLSVALLAGALAALLVGTVDASSTPFSIDSFCFWLLAATAAMRANV